jgi:anhydro-N-acetylmuramic acid kinase
LISGTSHDAIDGAIVDFSGPDAAGTLHGELILTGATPYDRALRARLIDALPPAVTDLAEVCQLDTLIGQAFAEAAASLIAQGGPVDAICSHGQTVYHWVEGSRAEGTLQLGDAAWIAEATGLPVVSNVRLRDITAGGHGAPLAALIDSLVLSPDPSTSNHPSTNSSGELVDAARAACAPGTPASPGNPSPSTSNHPSTNSSGELVDAARAALNLGGIANVTIVQAGNGQRPAQVVAFDTGPANALIDAAITSLALNPAGFDRDGRIAATGTVDGELLDQLLADPYYALTGPKSTGKEHFNLDYLNQALNQLGRQLDPADLVATLTELTAQTVADAVRPAGVDRLIVSGGGAHNTHLMNRLAALLPDAVIETADAAGLPTDSKEAILMALIGWYTLNGLPATIPSATGGRHASVLGSLTPGAGPLRSRPASTAPKHLVLRAGPGANLTVRPASQADLASATALFLDCWRENYRAFMPPTALGQMDPAQAEQLWCDSFAQSDRIRLIALDGAVTAGIAAAGLDPEAPSRGIIYSLYVSPACQGKGIGRRLIGAICGRLAGLGVDRVSLHVLADNAGAIAFYQRLGFEADGLPVPPEFGLPVISMTRRMAEPNSPSDNGHLGPVAAPDSRVSADESFAPSASRPPVDVTQDQPGGRALTEPAASDTLDDAAQAAAIGTVRLLRRPGGVVVSLTAGGIRSLAAAGVANSAGQPPGPGTIFDLASVSKVLGVTTMLAALTSQRAVQLDQTVERFLPGAGVHPGTTLRHLLTHRAGLWEWQPLYLAGCPPFEAMAQLGPRYPLDHAWHYSDLGFMLLGQVIGVITSQPLTAAFSELVAGPLGLRRTGYGTGPNNNSGPGVLFDGVGATNGAQSANPAQSPPSLDMTRQRPAELAECAIGDRAEKIMAETGEPYPVMFEQPDFAWRSGPISGQATDGNAYWAFGGSAGHAGLLSSTDDLLTWLEALAGPTGESGWPALGQFFQPGPDPDQALGWRLMDLPLDSRFRRLAYHPGFSGCAVGLWPGSGCAVTMTTNRLVADPPWRPTDQLWRATLAAAQPGLADALAGASADALAASSPAVGGNHD